MVSSLVAPAAGVLIAGRMSHARIVAIALVLSAINVAILPVLTAPLLLGASVVVLQFLTVFSIPFVFSTLATLDPRGRAGGMGPAFLLVGAAIGPSLGAIVIANLPIQALGIAAGVCIAVGALAFGYLSRGASQAPDTSV